MAYASIQDLVDTFGEKEIKNLAQSITGNRSDDLTDVANAKVVQSALDDACAEIDLELANCFNIKAIKELFNGGDSIPALKHFTKDIARYHLYTCIWLGTNANGKDHEAFRRYEDAIEHIRLVCEKGVLVDDQGNVLSNNNSILVAATCKKEVDTCNCGCHDCNHCGGVYEL